jgi:hypothetical protein
MTRKCVRRDKYGIVTWIRRITPEERLGRCILLTGRQGLFFVLFFVYGYVGGFNFTGKMFLRTM